MAVLLIAYLEAELPIERWKELAPDQIVQSARKMLKARDDAVAQAVRNLLMALEKSHEKGRRLAQDSARKTGSVWPRRGNNRSSRRRSLISMT
jgi:hypothetical protein